MKYTARLRGVQASAKSMDFLPDRGPLAAAEQFEKQCVGRGRVTFVEVKKNGEKEWSLWRVERLALHGPRDLFTMEVTEAEADKEIAAA